MIGAHGICRYFRQPDGTLFKALDDVNLEIGDGELAVIAGENGSGKSLLMKILAGLEKPTRGTVQADAMGLVFQDADAQILADTPLEDVLFGLRNRRDITKAQKRDIAVDSLSKVGLKDIADNPSHLLSGGQKRRLAVASILALGRRTMVFDEPYSNLDYPGVKSVNAVIRELKDDGYTILILTHELEKCLGLADRFVVLHKGRVAFDGKPADALDQNLEAWGIRNPAPGGRPDGLVWL
ncbi:MAG: ABC transporter ATP-binding protein [Spirochaetales bacterium]|nr:ABC transporter ATP-binding protein [Spirochaetales bacterium]MBQ5365068.1 ABC transporter ATP-binding protein [Spirochaetales bacterium]